MIYATVYVTMQNDAARAHQRAHPPQPTDAQADAQARQSGTIANWPHSPLSTHSLRLSTAVRDPPHHATIDCDLCALSRSQDAAKVAQSTEGRTPGPPESTVKLAVRVT